jgi:hypothetical protein
MIIKTNRKDVQLENETEDKLIFETRAARQRNQPPVETNAANGRPSNAVRIDLRHPGGPLPLHGRVRRPTAAEATSRARVRQDYRVRRPLVALERMGRRPQRRVLVGLNPSPSDDGVRPFQAPRFQALIRAPSKPSCRPPKGDEVGTRPTRRRRRCPGWGQCANAGLWHGRRPSVVMRFEQINNLKHRTGFYLQAATGETVSFSWFYLRK